MADSAEAPPPRTALLAVDDLAIGFPVGRDWKTAVRGVSFTAAEATVTALIGRSGAGKSLTGLAMLGLVPPPGRILGGEIRLEGRPLANLSEREWTRLRGRKIALIPQEPLGAFDPRWSVRRHFDELVRRHTDLSAGERAGRIERGLAEVGLAARHANAYAHELSGGERQRCLIAMAVGLDPRVVIADEPTSALDPSVRRQIGGLLRRLADDRRIAVLFSTHDFGLVCEVADNVVVLDRGEVAQEGSVAEVLENPVPVTRDLLEAVAWFGDGA